MSPDSRLKTLVLTGLILLIKHVFLKGPRRIIPQFVAAEKWITKEKLRLSVSPISKI